MEKVTLAPMLRVQGGLYDLPRGRERFRSYPEAMTGGSFGAPSFMENHQDHGGTPCRVRVEGRPADLEHPVVTHPPRGSRSRTPRPSSRIGGDCTERNVSPSPSVWTPWKTPLPMISRVPGLTP
jgi:hypothetical protein